MSRAGKGNNQSCYKWVKRFETAAAVQQRRGSDVSPSTFRQHRCESQVTPRLKRGRNDLRFSRQDDQGERAKQRQPYIPATAATPATATTYTKQQQRHRQQQQQHATKQLGSEEACKRKKKKTRTRAYPLSTTVSSSYSARKMRCRPCPPPVDPSSSMALKPSYSFSRRRGRSIPAMLTSCTTCFFCFHVSVLFFDRKKSGCTHVG